MVEVCLEDLPPEVIRIGSNFLQQNTISQLGWVIADRVIQGRFVSNKTYNTQIVFKDNKIETSCNCTIHQTCKHAAAIMIELLKAPAAEAQNDNSMPVLATLVADRVGKSLPDDLIRSLRRVQGWYDNKLTEIPKGDLFLFCGLGGGGPGGAFGNVTLFPKEYPPKDEWELLTYLAILAEKNRFKMPANLGALLDPQMRADLEKNWKRAEELSAWRAKFGRWQFSNEQSERGAPELRLQLNPDMATIQIRQPGEAQFVKTTQKVLRKLADDIRYGEIGDLIGAGSVMVFQSSSDEYSVSYSPEVQAFSKNLAINLRKLASSRELFDAHVVNGVGEPLIWVDEPLRWEILPPSEENENYQITLNGPEGIPEKPLAILRGRPMKYVTSRHVYDISLWPFGKDRMDFPVDIPAGAIESKEGVRSVAQLGAPLPPQLEKRVCKVRAEVRVRCRIHKIPHELGEYFQVLGEATFGGYEQPLNWDGNHWSKIWHESPQMKPVKEAKFIQIDKSPMPTVANWLRGMNFKRVYRDNSGNWLDKRMSGKDWPEQFLAWLEQKPVDCTVELDSDLASLSQGQVAGRIRLDIEESENEIDWFDLSVALSVDDTTLTQEDINLLLKAKGKWVRLDGKGWRRLVYELTPEQLQELADVGLAPDDFKAEKQRLHALQLGALAQRSNSMLGSERVEQVRRRVEEIQTRVTPQAPSAITATLRPYQLEGFHFLAYLTVNRFGGVLADDMGLGKTLQTLSWIAWLRSEKIISEPVLVVCPKSVQDNWLTECAKFFPDLNAASWTRDTVGKAGLDDGSDLLVINYAQLRLNEESLRAKTWGAVILDEAQAIKNPTSQSATAACSLRARYRLALTGTPIENRLLDLWSIFAFAMPGVLGTRSGFSKNFDNREDPLARRRLAARTRPFLLRRTKNEVARDLPDRVEEDIIVEMEGTQSKLYQAELKRARAQMLKVETSKDLDKLRFNILTSLLRLRQICCHPRLIGLEENSSKMKGGEESAKVSALLELLEPLIEEGQKVVVFSQFVEMLDIIRNALDEREWPSFQLTGKTENRGALVDSFQNHSGAGVFLISLKAGGSGLNLTAASYVVLFDPWWNPAVEAQAIDRTHRIGQKQTVFAYRLIIKNSIEEKIRQLQKQKSVLAKDILGEENFAQALTIQDFQFLLGNDA